MVKKSLSEEMFRDFLRVMPPYARQFADTLAPAEKAPAPEVIGTEAAPEANVDLAAMVRAVSEATGGTAVPPPLAGAALAEDPTGVFAAVQRRNNVTWWASFLIIVVLAATLLGGVIGAFITVLAGGEVRGRPCSVASPRRTSSRSSWPGPNRPWTGPAAKPTSTSCSSPSISFSSRPASSSRRSKTVTTALSKCGQVCSKISTPWMLWVLGLESRRRARGARR